MFSETEKQKDKIRGLNLGSRVSSEMPIVVNRAGKLSITSSFITHNTSGRLDYYLMYITDGNLSVTVGDEIKSLSSGDFVIFPPKYKYKYELKDGKLSYYFVHFTGSHTEKYLTTLGLTDNPTPRHAGLSEEISFAFSSFFTNYERGEEFSGLVRSVDFSRILVLLARSYHYGNTSSAVSKTLAYINGSYTEPIRIPHLAAMEGLSVSRYNAVFRQCVGVSPVRYITKLRMRQACMLLEGTDLAVKQISKIVGYEDNHFFSKIFKNYVGVSPVAYRENIIK